MDNTDNQQFLTSWNKGLLVLVVFVVVFLWMSQDAFRSLLPPLQRVDTSGANLRLSSVDSSANRGNSELAF
mgnify:CR=1 FL=1